MNAGILGKASLTAATITNIYTVPASTLANYAIKVCNRNASPVTVRLALSAVSVTQANDEFIEYNTTIPAYGVLERTGGLLQTGKIITAYSDTANVTVLVDGFEEAA